MVLPRSDKVSRASPYSISCVWPFAYGAITHYGQPFQTVLLGFTHLRATPRSLATTCGISVDFFSSGYLDVSVPRVRSIHLCIQCTVPSKLGGFPHSEIHGSKLVCQLPVTYRRLLRPSSPVVAKASTRCACSLDHITSNILVSLASRQARSKCLRSYEKDHTQNYNDIFRRQAPLALNHSVGLCRPWLCCCLQCSTSNLIVKEQITRYNLG